VNRSLKILRSSTPFLALSGCLLLLFGGGGCASALSENAPPPLPSEAILQDSVNSLLGFPRTSKTSEKTGSLDSLEDMESDLQKSLKSGLPTRKTRTLSNLPTTEIPNLRSFIRVLIKQSSRPIRVRSLGSMQVKSGTKVLGRLRQSFVVNPEDKLITVYDHNQILSYTSPDSLEFESLNDFNVFTLGTRTYRGKLQVFNRGGSFYYVNNLALEDYIRGVLPYEIPTQDHATLEATKAQAIAARTYALRHLNQYTNQPFDVYDDEKDQVYRGTQGETFLSDLAVKETQNVLLQYQGELAQTYYHSTCGGHTASIHDVWKSEPIRYLSARQDKDSLNRAFCAASPYSNWFESWALSDLTRMIRTYLPEAGVTQFPNFRRINNIEISEKTPNGRVKTMILDTDKGPIEVYGDKIRWLFRQTRNQNRILPSSHITRLSFGPKVSIEGSGHGHGIGLCQFGALERARRGQNYIDILYHYYPGTVLVILQ